MSADNGYVIQINSNGKYTLQHYFLSAAELPNPDTACVETQFDTLEEAVTAYAKMEESDDFICEYGLCVSLKRVDLRPLEQDDLVVIKDELNPQGHPYRIGRVLGPQRTSYETINVLWYSGRSTIGQTHRRINLQKIGHWSPE